MLSWKQDAIRGPSCAGNAPGYVGVVADVKHPAMACINDIKYESVESLLNSTRREDIVEEVRWCVDDLVILCNP
jgi:hypothetical protein